MLCSGLKNNSSLTSLNLYRNGIGPEGAKMISEGIQSNSTLAVLILHGKK